MELNINKDTTLVELKKQFARQFPNLKLEFFSQSHKREHRSLLTRSIADHAHLHSQKRLQKVRVFTFDSEMTVADFERRMKKELGLPVQVFREVEGAWIETKLTSDWSLGKHNAMSSATNRLYRFNTNSLFL